MTVTKEWSVYVEFNNGEYETVYYDTIEQVLAVIEKWRNSELSWLISTPMQIKEKLEALISGDAIFYMGPDRVGLLCIAHDLQELLKI